MKALTIKQPWAWAIIHGMKRVENRTWRPSPNMIGKRFAIHAAKVDDSLNACDQVIELSPPQTWPGRPNLVRSAIIGTARLIAVVDEATSSIEELAEYFGVRKHGAYCDIAWFSGPKGFILDDVIECEPFSCKGALGFWEAPAAFVDPWDAKCAR